MRLGWIINNPLCFFTIVIIAAMAEANQETVVKEFVKRKSLQTWNRVIRTSSKIQCLARCFHDYRENMCHIAGFKKATGECHLSPGDSSDVHDGDSDDDGVFILKGKHRIILNKICNSVLLKKKESLYWKVNIGYSEWYL